ncbi:MAG: putative toxin-antitoxin system toxin component, PIN family [Candidatus Altiarchaeales archaeon]|nr:putative toxin-antitoxin system toxin component, PIN family [Candidatus Altiarchaeota archaeon]MBU4341841.1 putative toxin-antitoxin system toxin component, PIN family [Candidatus Altiarchaeota archaeon]MBU4406289.1 putative toxin-antitoxin system toxin component, PIN family [Candidatus Altiarchaeota archaeon]MBU4437705.1 putative toxin-antitoxin system toxin component, PIN family [Candidatus Altiarchaeota archaeon]MCG2782674.1 putative toxin-antitoxin system toxin component, PIN family [Can
MTQAVLDTNILVSAAIARGNEFELLELAKEGRYELILSTGILEEFEGVVSQERFGFTKNIREEIINNVIKIAKIVDPKGKIDAIKEDPDDNKIIECALEGKADYIISGDKHLLKLGKFQGIEVITTTKFLELL